jgi:hypothetical protein
MKIDNILRAFSLGITEPEELKPFRNMHKPKIEPSSIFDIHIPEGWSLPTQYEIKEFQLKEPKAVSLAPHETIEYRKLSKQSYPLATDKESELPEEFKIDVAPIKPNTKADYHQFHLDELGDQKEFQLQTWQNELGQENTLSRLREGIENDVIDRTVIARGLTPLERQREEFIKLYQAQAKALDDGGASQADKDTAKGDYERDLKDEDVKIGKVKDDIKEWRKRLSTRPDENKGLILEKFKGIKKSINEDLMKLKTSGDEYVPKVIRIKLNELLRSEGIEGIPPNTLSKI